MVVLQLTHKKAGCLGISSNLPAKTPTTTSTCVNLGLRTKHRSLLHLSFRDAAVRGCVWPRESPGLLNLIRYSQVTTFCPSASQPALLPLLVVRSSDTQSDHYYDKRHGDCDVCSEKLCSANKLKLLYVKH